MLAALFVVTTALTAQTGAAPTGRPDQTQGAAAKISRQATGDRHQADVDGDIAEGKKYVEEVEKQYKLSENKDYQDRVQRIGADISAIANGGPVWHVSWGDKRLSKFDYTYKVLKSDDVNAFSLPGGHIYVFEGLMKEIESDDELAGVLAHETAHAAFRHVATLERDANKMTMISLPLILAAILFGGGGGNQANLAVPAIQLTNQAIMSGWSVKAEESADYGGMQFLLKSHYDPTGMLTFMERLASEEKLGPNYEWGIYRDHPPSKERAETLLRYMTDAGVQVRRSKVTTSFRVTVHPNDSGLVEVDFGKRQLFQFGGTSALTRADSVTNTLNSFFDATPELYDVQAGSKGSLLWQGKPLVTFTPDDATAARTTVDALRDKALQTMRIAMYNLGFHVWTSH